MRKKIQKSFSLNRAARLSRVGNRGKSLLSRIGANKGSVEVKVNLIAKEVLRKVPFDMSLDMGAVNLAHERMVKSISKKAAHTLTKKNPIGFFHCVERCNAAIGLLRKAGVKTWLARQVYFDISHGGFKIHDFVEFFDGCKVKTLAFGINEDGFDFFRVFNHTADKLSVNMSSAASFVFRGVDGSQIGGVTSYSKLKKFLENPFSMYETAKNVRRINLLVKSGIIPITALKEFG